MIEEIEPSDVTPFVIEAPAPVLTQREMDALVEQIAIFRGCLELVATFATDMRARSLFSHSDVVGLSCDFASLRHLVEASGTAFNNFILASKPTGGSA